MSDMRDRIAAAMVRATPATYQTGLTPLEEQMYQAWVAQNKVPTGGNDYDMRGFYRGLISGDPRATSAVNPNDAQMHYPDVWKTPEHETFSRESQWATPAAPSWNEQDQLVSPAGRIVFDERRKGLDLP